MSSPTTSLDDDHEDVNPSDGHGVESADVEALSSAELAELYARAGGQQPAAEARLKEIAEVKAILELLMAALEKDGGLDDKLQEQILAVGCEIEAKVSEALASGGTAGPDMAAVKGLLVQLVKLIEHGRAVAKKCAPKPIPVSLESDIMDEIAGSDTAEAEPSESESDEAGAVETKPVESEKVEAGEPTADESEQDKDAVQEPSSDPAMDALYQSLRVTDPPLLEQTAEGDIEVVDTDPTPETLPKCLTEPWDDKSPAPSDAKSGAAKSGLFAPLGRIFKKSAPKAS